MNLFDDIMDVSGSFTRVINIITLKVLRKEEDSARKLLIFTTHLLQSSSWLFTGQLGLRMLSTIEKKKKKQNGSVLQIVPLSYHYRNI